MEPSAIAPSDVTDLHRRLLPPSMPRDQLITLVAAGVTSHAWRDSPVEDWHCAGRISDGEMMRINSHTTARIRDLTRDWCNSTGARLDYNGDVETTITPSQFTQLIAIWSQWLSDPGRLLPTGQTLHEVSGGNVKRYAGHVKEAMGLLTMDMSLYGVAYPLCWTAMRGNTRKWWGSLKWPRNVETFMVAIDDAGHPHWGKDARLYGTGEQPAGAVDRTQLRRYLLDSPWELDNDTAGWVIQKGIGYVRHTPAGEELPSLIEELGYSNPHSDGAAHGEQAQG